jgi:hypothetical protein
MEFYLKFSWKNGTPFGIDPVQGAVPVAYRVIKDPYRKRFSVERYHNLIYQSTVYDSGVFDFRKLRSAEQKVWRREEIEQGALIRDEDDRVILRERYFFLGDVCQELELRSAQDLLVARQTMYYSSLGDPFDGALLFDLEGGVILWKKYALESETNQWSHVISQGWGNPIASRAFS